MKASLAFDYRSLALFRILIGCCVLADALDKLPHMRDMYSDLGLYPREALLAEFPAFFSLHLAHGSVWWGVALTITQLFFGVLLVLGLKARWAAIGSYLLYLSTFNRNWMVGHSGEDLFRSLLFLAAFLPIDSHFALDGKSRSQKFQCLNPAFFSSWVLAFTAEVIGLYFISTFIKSDAVWKIQHTALYFATSLDYITSDIGRELAAYPKLTAFLTIMTFYLERYAPWILVFSWLAGMWWWVPRFLMLALFFGFHFGIFISMELGLFAPYCLAMLTIFIPGKIWELLTSCLQRRVPAIHAHPLTRWFLDLPAGDDGNAYGLSEKKWPKWAYELAGALMLMTIIIWNVSTIPDIKLDPGWFGQVKRALYLDTRWVMFAPAPQRSNKWLELTGVLDNDKRVDLFNGSEDLSSNRYQNFLASIPDSRWRRQYNNLALQKKYAGYFAAYLCRNWNEAGKKIGHRAKLVELEVSAFAQPIYLHQQRGTITQLYRWQHKCGDKAQLIEDDTLQ